MKKESKQSEKQWILGCDPGKHGGIALLNINDFTDQIHFPTKVKNGRVDVVDMKTNIEPLVDSIVECYIEDVHALFGSSASGTFEFGHATGSFFGMLQTLLGHKLTVCLIQPKEWQKVAWKTTPIVEGEPVMDHSTGKQKVNKNGDLRFKIDTKATSLAAANALFPGVSWLASSRCKSPHDGIVDAALIAYAAHNKTNVDLSISAKEKKKRK